jgi:aerobic-type carbon monoxide dehydrogenase small subunit (CoxS/CutS family)
MSLKAQPLQLTINGAVVGPIDVPEGLMMIDFLHEYMNLTGSRFGCGQGVCHACVVILDGEEGSKEVRTCITGAHFFDRKKIRTVEGLARRDAGGNVIELAPIQQKFLDHYGFQCGYCTPGFVNAATVFIEKLQRQPISSDRLEDAISEALKNHICRCTGYVRYFEAVKDLVLTTPGLVEQGRKK